MGTRAAPRTSSSRAAGRGRPATRARPQRRRLLALVAFVGLLVFAFDAAQPQVDRAVVEVTLPLRHDDIIRQQAEDKDLDPALIAAVIYAESRFTDATSSAGARGLMQVTPDTARVIARRSGGTSFTEADLATPQINIAYGSYHLRWLLDRYDGDEALAVAAYNAGEGNVDAWIAEGRARGQAIPFPETRAYVAKVLDARRDYRREHGAQLGR
jgi:soluble lytic murein transglycosylase